MKWKFVVRYRVPGMMKGGRLERHELSGLPDLTFTSFCGGPFLQKLAFHPYGGSLNQSSPLSSAAAASCACRLASTVSHSLANSRRPSPL